MHKAEMLSLVKLNHIYSYLFIYVIVWLFTLPLRYVCFQFVGLGIIVLITTSVTPYKYNLVGEIISASRADLEIFAEVRL